MQIINLYDDSIIKNTDMFITCLGYEERSYYLLDKYMDYITGANCYLSSINDIDMFDSDIQKKIDEKKKAMGNLFIYAYEEDGVFQANVINAICELKKCKDNIQIDIDYSSMPRSWYCKLPELLSDILEDNDIANFWYSEGEYVESADSFSTVGIESYRVYSGKASLNTQRSRTHIIGVGYDAVRTQGILSILDPDNYIICNAYNPEREDIHNNVIKLNSSIIEQTSINISLYINDFEFIVAKIKGLINELYYAGESDIIIVPDGPKPLIFAMSMMPWLVGREGITCLHILRNSKEIKRINVQPRGSIVGFQMNVE